MGIQRSWRANCKIKKKGRDNTTKPNTQSIAVSMEYYPVYLITDNHKSNIINIFPATAQMEYTIHLSLSVTIATSNKDVP